jgi:hypothetical protein
MKEGERTHRGGGRRRIWRLRAGGNGEEGDWRRAGAEKDLGLKRRFLA